MNISNIIIQFPFLQLWIVVLSCVLIYICLNRNIFYRVAKHVKSTNALKIGGSHLVYKDFPNITFYVRTASDRRLLSPFYCILFRTAVFFWPAGYGKMVLVLDDSNRDRKFGQRFQKQIKEHYPERTLEVYYEPLPGKRVNTECNMLHQLMCV